MSEYMESDQVKLKRLRDISDEVGELHPLLRALFPKLPGIQRVEYTHGPNEMGADFVLQKRDETLDDVDYVGVIAKVDSVKQDHDDIERQIKECGIERLVDGGKRKVFLTEIWVATVGTISQNAKVKINNDHKNTKIKFFDGQRLFSLIEQHYKDYWSDVTVQIGEYLRSVRQQADAMSAPVAGFSPQVSNLIERDLEEIKGDRKFGKKPWKSNRKRIGNILQADRLIVIEAPMGCGKSTLLGQIAKQHAENESFNAGRRLPILASARELYEQHDCDLMSLCAAVIANNNLPAPESIVVLIDAFDELRLDLVARSDAFKKLYASVTGQLHIQLVLACRPIEDPELSGQLVKNFSCYRLCPLSISQVVRLVGDICGNEAVTKRLNRDIEKSHVFRALPRTPISALLLARLLKENIQEIPSTMTELYSKYMELVLGRWDMSKGLQSQMEYDVLSNIVSEIGKFSIENSITDIPLGDVEAHIQNYVDARNLKIDKKAALNLLLSKTDIFSFNQYSNTVSFCHRTFGEFFYASCMIKGNDAVISPRIFDLYWSTSYFWYGQSFLDTQLPVSA